MSRRDWWQPADDLACGLLVSVRDPAEAAAAVAGGATIIDVKEPDRGPLGRADAAVASAVAGTVGRRPWTIAAGELREGSASILAHVSEVLRLLPANATPPAAVKVGLAGVGGSGPTWEQMLAAFVAGLEPGIDPVPVAYLDWEQAQAPEPCDVIGAAARHGCRLVLFDTCDKQGGGAGDSPLAGRIPRWDAAARDAGLAVALAGGIDAEHIAAALGLRPAVLGFRTAACDGGRFGRISGKRVARLGTLCRPAAAGFGGKVSGARA